MLASKQPETIDLFTMRRQSPALRELPTRLHCRNLWSSISTIRNGRCRQHFLLEDLKPPDAPLLIASFRSEDIEEQTFSNKCCCKRALISVVNFSWDRWLWKRTI
jgi:hypothetical protein